MAEMFATVAAERDGIATEPPVDIEERAALFARTAGGSIVAVAVGRIVGMIHVEVSRHGFGELAMLVDRGWRGPGGGPPPGQGAGGWARPPGPPRLPPDLSAHNTAAIALYRRSGFAEEGRRISQYRRANGELWDAIVMGLLL